MLTYTPTEGAAVGDEVFEVTLVSEVLDGSPTLVL